MAYRAFLLPNKPCFLILLYLPRFIHLKNERSLFDVDSNVLSYPDPYINIRWSPSCPFIKTESKSIFNSIIFYVNLVLATISYLHYQFYSLFRSSLSHFVNCIGKIVNHTFHLRRSRFFQYVIYLKTQFF